VNAQASSQRDRVTTALQLLGLVGTTAAGTAAFVYLLGGGVMWLRLRKAGLHPDDAVLLLPRDLLLIVGVRQVILPAATIGLAFYLLARLVRRVQEDRPERRSVGVWSAWSLRSLELFIFGIGILILAVTIPWTWGGLTWMIAIACVMAYYLYLSTRGPRHNTRLTSKSSVAASASSDQQIGPSSPTSRIDFPVWKVVIAAVVAVAVAALARELERLLTLQGATLITTEGQTVWGAYISSTSDAVYVAVRRNIVVIPRMSVKRLSLHPPVNQGLSPSLLDRVFFRVQTTRSLL
jgi:hypothetical protein